MNPEPDFTPQVRDWLRSDEHETSPRLLVDVLERVDVTPQRSNWALAWPSLGRPSIARQALAAALVVAVALAGVQLFRSGGVGGPSPSASVGSPAPIASFPVTGTDPSHSTPLQAGPVALRWPLGRSDARIEVVVPSGWAYADEPIIFHDRGRLYGFSVDLSIHAPGEVVTSLCAADGAALEVGPTFAAVGPTAADLVAAILAVGGTTWSAPESVLVGGYPATRLETTFDASDCAGRDRRWLWEGDGGGFFVEDRVRAVLRIVDVDGAPLVIATEQRDATSDEVAQLDAIVASIQIDPGSGAAPPPPTQSPDWAFPVGLGPDADLRTGRHLAAIEGIPFTFEIAASGWESHYGFAIAKSVGNGQAAEAILRWTVLPDGALTAACPAVALPAVSASAIDVARAVARAPGVEVVGDPTMTTVDARPAAFVEVVVREDRGCDPGYFYTYAASNGGAFWTETGPQDVILVWAVEIDGRILLIEGELHPGWGATPEQIRAVVASMRFR